MPGTDRGPEIGGALTSGGDHAAEESAEVRPSAASRLATIAAFVFVAGGAPLHFAAADVFQPDWQTGKFTDKAALYASEEVTALFLPFIVVAWMTTLATIAAGERASRFAILRLGVYSSVVLAVHYLVLTAILTYGLTLGVLVIVLILKPLTRWVGDHEHRKRFLFCGAGVFLIWVCLFVAAALGLVSQNADDILSRIVMFAIAAPFAVLLFSGPALFVVISVRLAMQAKRIGKSQGASSIRRAMTAVASVVWVVGYLRAWRLGAARAMERYAELPSQPPDCFVATASAGGHPRFVGSRQATTTSGQVFAVTTQLQRLKAAELLLQVVVPSVHRRLRMRYNQFGPRLASALSTPLRCDLSYVALTAIEVIAWPVVRLFAHDAENVTQRIYVGDESLCTYPSERGVLGRQ